MVTSILIIVSCAVYFLIVSLCYAFCSITRISRICAKRDEIILKLRTVNDYQCNQIDQFIHIAEDQNEVLHGLVKAFGDLELGVETTEYLVKAVLKNQYNKKSGETKNESRKKA